MIAPDSLLPAVISEHPGTRRVFDAYGLHGCGGPRGPQESVEFFARVHGVPLDRLLAELEAAKDAPPPPYVEELGDVLYRRFFRAAIVVILTAGATLGAAVLLLYGLRGTFDTPDLAALVQAHANAQVFGWVGLFVMGFALQGFPRFKYVRLRRPELANVSFLLMIAGLVVRSAGALPAPRAVAVGGAAMEAASVALFAAVLAGTLRESKAKDVWDRYVGFALACFVAAGLAEPFLALGWGPSGPYRDLQLLGFAGVMILGVAQRVLPTAFGFREVRPGLARAAFPLLAGGLAVDLAGGILGRPGLAWAGGAVYALGALALAAALGGPWGGEAGRSTKFIRAAWAWMGLACLMMLAEPLQPTHAYRGAIRHAFTVGFVSLMILGVSSKVVPVLQGIDVRGLPSLWAPFVLVNLGNALRVGSQVATDFAPGAAFPVMGASGCFEVAGLAIWGVHLWGLLGRRAVEAPHSDRIEPETTVARIAERWPETLDVFENFGFKELRNPLLRNTVGRRVTVRMACGLKHVDEGKLLEALRRVTNQPS